MDSVEQRQDWTNEITAMKFEARIQFHVAFVAFVEVKLPTCERIWCLLWHRNRIIAQQEPKSNVFKSNYSIECEEKSMWMELRAIDAIDSVLKNNKNEEWQRLYSRCAEQQ